jgi:Domain of unknown function (DUF4282)
MTEPTQPGQSPVSWTPPPSEPSGKPSQAFDFGEFIAFRYLITPTLVTVIYVIGAVLITIFAVVAMTQGAGGIVSGLLLLLFGNLYWRVILEFIMVLFRMNDALQSIDRRGRGV